MSRVTWTFWSRMVSVLLVAVATGTLVAMPEAGSGASSDLIALYGATERFGDFEAALDAGYAPAGSCMAGEDGAQGIHFAHPDLMVEPVLTVERPQLLMYEPREDGSLRFLGVEYLVFVQAWHDAGNEGRPTLFGLEFGLNETLLDEPFYLLHVWTARFNPSGVFADWNPLVACSTEDAG